MLALYGVGKSFGAVRALADMDLECHAADVRPLLVQLREEMGLDPDPVAAYPPPGTRRRS